MTFDGNRKLLGGHALATYLLLMAGLLAGNSASAYTPDDPVILKMVERGIGYLEKVDWAKFGRPKTAN